MIEYYLTESKNYITLNGTLKCKKNFWKMKRNTLVSHIQKKSKLFFEFLYNTDIQYTNALKERIDEAKTRLEYYELPEINMSDKNKIPKHLINTLGHDTWDSYYDDLIVTGLTEIFDMYEAMIELLSIMLVESGHRKESLLNPTERDLCSIILKNIDKKEIGSYFNRIRAKVEIKFKDFYDNENTYKAVIRTIDNLQNNFYSYFNINQDQTS